MPTIPGELLPWIDRQFVDGDANPLDGGKVYAYTTGTVTPKDTFADALLTTPNANPVILDGTGRGTIFLESGGYDFLVTTADDVELYTVSNVENVSTTFFGSLGTTLATGAIGQTSGYTVLSTVNFVSMSSTGGADPCIVNLPLATAYTGGPLTVKNLGTVVLAITPAGSDTIDTVAGPYTVPVAATPLFPSVLLASNGASGWYILASHGG